MKKGEKKDHKFIHILKTIGRTLFVKTEKEHSEEYDRRIKFFNDYSAVFHALASLLIVFIVEAISHRNVMSAMRFIRIHPLAYIYNSFIVFATLMITYLFRRRTFTRVIVSSVWLLLGIINGCILSNRVTPFTYSDLKCISDLLSMTNTNYFTAEQATAVVIGAIIFFFLMVVLFIKGPRYQGRKNPVIIPVLVAAVLFVGIPAVTDVVTSTHVVDTYYSNIAQGYADNGLIYSFSSTVIDRGMSEPADYGEELINETLQDVQHRVEPTDLTTEKPNIICILLESVVDPEEIKFLSTNEDPIPYLHALEEQFSYGYCTVPVVGAGTANTEFEVLTGMSVQYFGTGEYPYKTILKQTDCESVASDLNAIGYKSHVVHNNGGNFYSRANAFKVMGFNTFTSKECLNISEYTPNGNWAEDDILIDATINAMKSTEEKDFVYTITVGTHGDYPTTQILENPTFEVYGCETEAQTNQWTYYMEQLHKTDLFVRNLTERLNELGENTVVVMFGDHLPTMGLADEDMVAGDIYKTKYWTWNNMGLEKKDTNLYAYQLLAETTANVGIHEGTIFNYHQAEMRRWDKETYLNRLELLQYDLLYGKRYAYQGVDKLIINEDFAMGIDEVTIERVTDSSNSSMIVVTGSGFTPWTKIYVNDEKVQTTFISGEMLGIPSDLLEDGDTIVANIVGSSNTIFRSSNVLIYVDPSVTSTEAET